jgi:hypothetical protein
MSAFNADPSVRRFLPIALDLPIQRAHIAGYCLLGLSSFHGPSHPTMVGKQWND